MRSCHRFWRELWWLILAYGFFLLGYRAWHVWQDWMRPVGGNGGTRIVSIVPGSSFMDVATSLENEGLIPSRYGFTILAWWGDAVKMIQAGEYEFFPSQSPEEILSNLVEGRILQHVVIIPEGHNLYQVAGLLDRAALVPRKAFLAASRDPDLLQELGIDAETVEGYLFPDTYYLVRGVSARDVITRFVSHFWEVWGKEGFVERTASMGVSVHDVVTLASIVEKEASVPEERPLIAGVFWNRLRKGMPLQADPTVYYGLLSESVVKRGRLRRADLRRATPYNTYVQRGLPVGPIANPSRDALRAVLFPEKTSHLYFVSKNDGSHHFSRTLGEHNRAVDCYQRHREPKLEPTTDTAVEAAKAPDAASPDETLKSAPSETN